MSRRATFILYATSLLVHAIAGGALAGMDGTRPPPEVTHITMRSVPAKPQAEEPPPPEPEPEVAEPEPIARPSTPPPTPPPVAAPAAPAAPAEFGVALGNLGAGGPGGIAVPVGNPGASEVPRVTRTAERQVAPVAPQATEPGCPEPDTRPRPLSMPRPAYTEAARAAAVEGRVRIELTVDESGNITSKRVVASLGHGLDEAALSAVEGARFEPAMHCGSAVASTFVLSVRFTL
jgi:periplasmic protein TonB